MGENNKLLSSTIVEFLKEDYESAFKIKMGLERKMDFKKGRRGWYFADI